MLEIYFRVTPCHATTIVPEIEWNRWRRTSTLLAHGSDTSYIDNINIKQEYQALRNMLSEGWDEI